jgi:class 3 adenylate cyclase
MLSASSSKPTCVPSQREYVNRVGTAVEGIRATSLTTMRVLRTFAFVDLAGFTNYTAAQGDDASGHLLSEFRASTRRLASDRGVRVAKWLGDGCMVVSVDQGNVVTFSLELTRETAAVCAPLAPCVGIATGLALLFEGDDYIGSAVNLAARLSDVAERNEVLMPTEQAVDLPEGVLVTPYGDVSLRGFPDPVSVVNLSGTPVLGGRHDTGELWTHTPFVA